MLRNVLFCVLGLIGVMPAISFAQERIWKDSSGSFSVKAEFVGIEDGLVQLRRSDNGKMAVVPLIRLSDEDRQFLIDLKQPKPESDSGPGTPPSTETPKPKAPPSTDSTDSTEPKEPILTTDPPAGSDNNDLPSVPPAETETVDSSNPDMEPSPKTAELAAPPADPGTLRDAAPIMPFRPASDDDQTKRTAPNGDHRTGSENTANSKTEAIPRFRRPGEDNTATGDQQDENETPDEVAFAESGQKDSPMIFEEPLPVIDAANVRLESLESETDLAQRSDEQLLADLRLSSSLAWKGNSRLSALLQSQPPNLEFTIKAEANFLDATTNAGFVTFQAISDNIDRDYEPVSLPPAVASPVRGWVSVTKQQAVRFLAAGNPLGLGIELGRPKTPLESMKTVSGEFRIQFGLTRSLLTLSDVSTNHGRLEHAFLAEKRLSVIVRHPDETTLVIEFTGNTKDVTDVRLTGGNPTLSQGNLNSMRSKYYQFDFAEPVPPNLDLVIEIVVETRDLTVPFEFQDVPLQVSEN